MLAIPLVAVSSILFFFCSLIRFRLHHRLLGSQWKRKLQVSSYEGMYFRNVQLCVSQFYGDGRVGGLIYQYVAAGCQMVFFFALVILLCSLINVGVMQFCLPLTT